MTHEVFMNWIRTAHYSAIKKFVWEQNSREAEEEAVNELKSIVLARRKSR